MVSAPLEDIAVGSWVARFRFRHDERPQLGLVRDSYDGNLNLDIYSCDGRVICRHLAPAFGPDCAREWEAIDPPDFQQLSAVFSYGKFVVRRRAARVRAPLALLRANRTPNTA